MPSLCAAADIGSNTAHLLVGATNGSLVTRIDNFNEWIPLGEMVARTGTIPNECVDQLIAAVKEFKRLASAKSAESLYIFATEAIRAASNGSDVIKKIQKGTGVKIDIITPRREVELSLRGALLDTREAQSGLFFEVGGGSVQIATVIDGLIEEHVSLPIGTGRLIAEAGLANPCPGNAFREAKAYVDDMLSSCDIKCPNPRAVASGGVARGLWRALHPDGDKLLTKVELDYVEWATRGLSVDRIVARFNVKTKRAGTLLPGAIVYKSLLEKFGLNEMTVSEFGVREGAILEMASGKIELCPV